MPADARAMAWYRAWVLLDAARKSHEQIALTPGSETVTLRHCKQLVSEAEIHSRLACAPAEVGEAVGEYIQRDQAREAEGRQKLKEFLDGR